MSVPNTFASATTSIPLANLDANFAYYDAAFAISGSAVTFAGSITLTTGTANGVPYLNASKVLTSGAVLTFDGTTLSSTKFAGALNGTVGATTPTTGAFTTLSATQGGTQTPTFTSTVNGSIVETILVGKNSTGTARQVNFGINRFADDVWSLSNGTTEYLRGSLTSGGLAVTGTLSATGTINGRTTNGTVFTTTNGSDADLTISLASALVTQNVTGSLQLQTGGSNRAVISSTGLAVTGTLSATGSGTLTNLLFSGGTLPGAGTPSIALRSSDNVIYHQAGSANQIAFLDSAQNSMASLTSTSLTFNISNVNKLTLNSTGLQVVNTLSGGTSGTGYSFDGSAPAGSLTLNSSGNLGIGTTSPTDTNGFGRAIDVQSNGGAAIYFRASGTSPSTAFFNVGYSPSAAYLINQANSPMLFYTNALERARISSDGTFRVTGAGAAGSTDAFQVAGTAPADAARIDSSGNLGIGTSSPDCRLMLETPSGTACQLNLSQTAVTNYRLSIPASTDALTFVYGASTERMRIDSSGNLLVGTTSVSLVSSASVSAGVFYGTQASATTVCLQAWNQATSGDNKFVEFYTEGGSGTLRGSITYNRAGGLTAYNVTSDYRAKDITGPVTNSGELIDSVPVYMGKMKDATQERPMFLAHETPVYAHTGVKDAVDADGNPVYQQMDAGALIPVMWAELQSLRARVAQLESKP